MKEEIINSLVATIRSGGVAILRTDTLYGVVASAGNQAAVRRVHSIKHRSPDKALIVLIADPAAAYDGHELIERHMNHEVPTTIIVDSPRAPSWIQHFDGTVAYRVPASAELRQLLQHTGPLVAPSANPEGNEPAWTIADAKAYFGDLVDLYVDGGEVPSDTAPSHIVRIGPHDSEQRIR